MPNVIDSTGLKTKTLTEILHELQYGAPSYAGFYAIFGAGINIGPNSPDGNLLNIIAQVAIDMEELLAAINASFDPDQAVGTLLDARCAINGVSRQGATYTVQNILVTVTAALTLPGLNTSSPFTVADANGNQFQLITSNVFGGAGAVSLPFRAAQIGAVLTTVNTITNIVTGLLGVASVNNPTAATSIGQDQETDAALRIRRANSVSLPSKGFLEGLLGALVDIPGVVQAKIYENNTNATVGGIPGHSIWVIVNAPGSLNAAIAQAIYVKRNAGCGMLGAITVNVAQIDGTTFAIKFDNPTLVPLYINFNYTVLTGADPGAVYIRAQLLARLTYQIGQTADVTTIEALLKAIAPNIVVTAEGVSLSNAGYAATLVPATVAVLFVPATTTVYINGTPG